MPETEELKYAAVILDSGIDKPLDYQIPLSFLGKIKKGMRVLVPVKGKLVKGTIFDLKDKAEVNKVLPISEIVSDEALVTKDLFLLAEWMSRYYCASFRRIFKLFLPPSVRKEIEIKKQRFIFPLLAPKELSLLCEKTRSSHPLQAQVLDVLLQTSKGLFLSELLEKAAVSRSPVDTLIKKNILGVKELDPFSAIDAEYLQTKPKTLGPEQQEALDKIKTSLEKGSFETHLLHGVTGSGKTEIYLQAIEQALALEKGVIFLVPEIALTSQTIEHLRTRFARKIAVLHHRLSQGERHEAWHQIRKKEVSIVIGARSALFSPMPHVGLIIVDEEQENSYKQQDEAPCYHARDVAVMRGKICQATTLLGSATPTLETYSNALSGKYILSTLNHRIAGAVMPQVTIVDMGQEKAFLFSDILLEAIKKRTEKGEQSLLFLNRRGFHTSQSCKSCFHVIKCPHCDTSLTHHLGLNTLACHLCDFRLSPPPRVCPSCGSGDSLKYKGAGTEQVEKALHAIFPQIRTLRLDADTTRHKGSHEELFKQFRSGKADVLIGTQMVAKGLHFPFVTLAAILNADAALAIPDFRASEHLFQLITQVAGRAGRGVLPGEVIIQTHLPNHSLIQQASCYDIQGFYNAEMQVRKEFGYPPFTHLAKLVFSGPSEKKVLDYAVSFRNDLITKLPPSCEIHPIIPCGRAKMKDNYRFNCLIKTDKMPRLAALLDTLHKQQPPRGNIRLLIDIDPISTY